MSHEIMTQVLHLLGLIAVLVVYWVPRLWIGSRHYRFTAGLVRYPLNIPYYFILFNFSLVAQPMLQGLALPRAIIGWSVFAIGFGISVVGCYQLIIATHFSVDARKLDTGGIFSLLRNPQMAGGFHLQLGFAIALGAVYGIIMSFACLALYVIEEALEARYLLEPEFGEEYRAYHRRVKGFIPYVI